MRDSVLIELLTEELPPKSLRKLARAFGLGIFEGLLEEGFVAAGADYARCAAEFATPRRLAVLVKDVADKQPDRIVERKGPALVAAFDKQGAPTPALAGFAKSCGVSIEQLHKQSGAKGEYFVARLPQSGEFLEKKLAGIVQASVKALPVAKLMRWGDGEAQFVRPVHGLMMLHGRRVIPGEVLGLKSGHQTKGHRFLGKGPIILECAEDYERALREQGGVVADYAARLRMIEQQLDAAVKKFGATATWRVGETAELLEEVTSLVEFPAVYAGNFDKTFLDVPSECLIVSMRQHQRYFPLADNSGGRLLPHFLFVSNNQTDAPAHIIHGNERVLKARLSDAKFFFEQDKKTTLAERVPKLAQVVYHNKLGTQLERVERVQKLAADIAAKLVEIRWVDEVKDVERAAYLCKADLLTGMVGEFPELQGVMGYYYALHDGEAPQVAEAIREHYERVPRSPLGICVGLADKLDTLVGIYGIGLVPTGDKDPFGLRRQALSILRTLIENGLSLSLVQLLEVAEARFRAGTLADDTVPRIYEFMMERLKFYLREKGYAADEIDAVLSLRLTRMDWVLPRLAALREFRKLPEAESLAAANKRIRNILKQAPDQVADSIQENLLHEVAEKNLAQQLDWMEEQVMPLLQSGDYTQALTRLAALRPAVDEFFDKVMVMVDDAALRKNRLALLNKLSGLFMRAADLSKLQS
ncbi:MAG: glycine--tRNA ligase subunit beta [Pseudomonadota bacterium]